MLVLDLHLQSEDFGLGLDLGLDVGVAGQALVSITAVS